MSGPGCNQIRYGESLILSDAHDGDVVSINGRPYRMMIRIRDAWGCREQQVDGSWSTLYSWFLDEHPIDGVVLEQPRRGKNARKDKGDLQDPMKWRGTQR